MASPVGIGGRPATRPVGIVRVRMHQLVVMLSALGYETDVDRAGFLGLTPRTLSRLRGGEPAGAAVIAQTLIALGRNRDALHAAGFDVTFEAVFEPTLAR